MTANLPLINLWHIITPHGKSTRQLMLSYIKINLFHKDFITAQHIIQIPATQKLEYTRKFCGKIPKRKFSPTTNILNINRIVAPKQKCTV